MLILQAQIFYQIVYFFCSLDSPDRIVFVLTPRPEAEDLEAYAEGSALVNVGDFGRSLRTLKRALWRAKDGRQ